jgi:hypothetical protein
MYLMKTGESFIKQYNHPKKNGAKKPRTGGNFTDGLNGDIVVTTSLSCHARTRIKERGISIGDALKGTQKSGAVLSDNGKVITVIPDSSKKNAGTIARRNNEKPSKVPSKDQNLPVGHCMESIDIPSDVCGLILGVKHANILKMSAKYPRTQYEMNDNKMSLWGPEDEVKALTKDIEVRLNQLMNEERVRRRPPPLPEGELPPGHIKIHWIIAQRNICHVIGKDGKKLAELKKEHPAASIHINSETGQTYIFGEATDVNIVRDKIASITLMANKMRAQNNAWIESRAKSSPRTHNKKDKHTKKKQQKQQKQQQKQVQKQQEQELTATELRIFRRAKFGNKKTKKMEKNKKARTSN